MSKFFGKAVSTEFLQKLYGNCAFPKNLHTRKLVDITVFYAVDISVLNLVSKFKYRVFVKHVAQETVLRNLTDS